MAFLILSSKAYTIETDEGSLKVCMADVLSCVNTSKVIKFSWQVLALSINLRLFIVYRLEFLTMSLEAGID
jgi:hypothetical protein